VPDSITLCRDSERALVKSFCEERLSAGLSGSIYISGVPGTGKTLTLREVEITVRQWEQPPAVVSINCMALPDPHAVWPLLSVLHQARLWSDKSLHRCLHT
jgi:Cdc6-like AAA superfamily ATPase